MGAPAFDCQGILLAMAHMQAVLAMEYSSEEYWEIDEAVAERIEQNFPSRQADSDLYTGFVFLAGRVN